MKKHAIPALCLVLMVGLALAQSAIRKTAHTSPSSAATSSKAAAPPRAQNSSSPPQITGEEAFYYNVAIFGNPDSFIDSYAEFFDANNYARAMSDEFERARYRAAIHQRLVAGAGGIDFSKRFTFISAVRLGEYSFENHAFPIQNIQGIGDFAYFNYYVAGRGFEVNPFVAKYAVNGSDFSWTLPMPEAAGSAFVKGRADRSASIRIIYSVTRKAEQHSNRSFFVPFIYSMEVYDTNTAQKLGVLPKISSLVAPPLNRADQQLADQRANEQRDRNLVEAPHTLIGEWRGLYAGQYDGGEGTVSLQADGGYKFTSNDGYTASFGTWSVSADLLTFTQQKCTKWGSKIPCYDASIRSRILEIDLASVTMEPLSSTRWNRYKWTK